MDNPKLQTSRRKFFIAVGTGGTAAVAAIAVKTAPHDAASDDKKAPAGSGYQLTEHIRNYYRTTLV